MTAGTVRRIAIGTGVALLAIIALTIALIWFLLDTSTGARWALRAAQRVLPGELAVARIEGPLSGPLLLERLHYADATAGLDVRVERLQLDLQMRSLWHLELHVRELDVHGVDAAMSSVAAKPEPAPSQPFSLEAPVDIRIDDLHLTQVIFKSDNEPVFAIDAAAFSGAWIGTTIDIEQLDVRAPQGEVHLQGSAGGDRGAYTGETEGRFRWEVAGRVYAGTLKATAEAPQVSLIATLTSPVTANVQIGLEQSETLPWTLQLDVPRFDPRESLLQGSSFTSLAASLTGRGDRSRAAVQGRFVLNDEALQIDRLDVEQSQEQVTLAAVLRPPQGEVRLAGTVALGDPPASADIDFNWQRVTIPAAWAGQILHVHGEMALNGNAQRYEANGSMRIGPPDRVADARFEVEGTPTRIALQRFDIIQTDGQVHASGTVDLSPHIAWELAASAERFDPSEFFVAWPGNLTFDLQTQGRLPGAGPEARLQLSNLSGELRGQQLTGHADLSLTSQRVLAGTLELEAGDNRIAVHGQPGQRIDARVLIDAPSLASLAPQIQGAVRGRVTAQGLWPHLQTTGELNASALQFAGLQAQRAEVDFAIDEPLDPRGQVTIDAEQLTLSGLTFTTLNASAEGSAAEHSLKLAADGERLAADLSLRGARTGTTQRAGWSGSLDRLLLDVVGTTQLALQTPVEIDYAPPQMSVSRACLAGTGLRLCVEGNARAAGAFDVEYSLHEVPLSLISSAAPTLPVTLSGSLNGEGRLQRDANGILGGRASLQSAQGEIARTLETQPDAPQVLLRYDDLSVQAQLQGREAQAEVSARLNESGQLRGAGTLTDVGTAAGRIQGQLAADLPSIAVIEAFVPQLANLAGQLSLRAEASGPLDAPVLNGEARLASLSADLPMLGLKLRDGGLRVTPRPDGTYAIDGAITSGDGTLQLDGSASLQGATRINMRGEQLLAADIAGARVIIDPQLEFTREQERMTLTGKLHIPSADINVQKLPRGESTQSISEDVVVIDATTREEEEQAGIPLHASVDVTLGDAVKLTGFGLDATVAGQLEVREAPGSPTIGAGEVRVTGTYKAYGQDLAIRQGHLLYAGTPLDNPRLSIVAVREVEPVVAGLRVEGSARNPQLTVFAEPTMSESNALSYLIAGKPLSDIGEGEGDAVQSAARTLGTAAGGLLAKNVGRRLGVDELGITDSEAIGGSALTIGQYLSPRLYLSYGIGLFEPGEVVTLRYKLSDQTTVEVLNGPIDSRAGIEYRVEK